jgi:hypothetical protein
MTIGTLLPRDFDDFVYDWGRTYSIFFSQPLTLVVPGVGKGTFGSGLGGFSPSIFSRGMKCIACGRCCYGRERVWTWFVDPDVTPPEDTSAFTIFVNGAPVPLWVHVNRGDPRIDGCDYLINKGSLSLDGVTPSQGFCRLWAEGRDLPTHCRQLPDYAVYPVRGTPLLSRRLPPRNWRAPKCPIDVASLPLDQETIEKDRYVWHRWLVGLRGLPGCHIEEIYELWEKLLHTPPRTPVLFSEFV